VSLCLGGERVDIPDLDTACWLDDAKAFPPAPHVYKRRRDPPQMIVVHATVGNVGPLWPEPGPPGNGERFARYLATTPRAVSWDFTIDKRGKIAQHNDPATSATWHATHVNRLSLGIELEQEADGTTYAAQYPALVALCRLLCARFGIPEQVSARDGAPCLQLVPGLTAKASGWKRAFGVLFHCNLTSNRGPGDPGPHAGEALLRAGFAPVDFAGLR
jgi:hypothetical protein